MSEDPTDRTRLFNTLKSCTFKAGYCNFSGAFRVYPVPSLYHALILRMNWSLLTYNVLRVRVQIMIRGVATIVRFHAKVSVRMHVWLRPRRRKR